MRVFDVKLDTTTADNIKTHFEINSAIFINNLTIDFSINRINFHII